MKQGREERVTGRTGERKDFLVKEIDGICAHRYFIAKCCPLDCLVQEAVIPNSQSCDLGRICNCALCSGLQDTSGKASISLY